MLAEIVLQLRADDLALANADTVLTLTLGMCSIMLCGMEACSLVQMLAFLLNILLPAVDLHKQQLSIASTGLLEEHCQMREPICMLQMHQDELLMTDADVSCKSIDLHGQHSLSTSISLLKRRSQMHEPVLVSQMHADELLVRDANVSCKTIHLRGQQLLPKNTSLLDQHSQTHEPILCCRCTETSC